MHPPDCGVRPARRLSGQLVHREVLSAGMTSLMHGFTSGGIVQRIALHTRLAAGKEEVYDEVHAVIPAALDAALREAGVFSWRIWRDGRDLFHMVEVEDYQRMRHRLRDHPVNVEWQARMAELLEVPDDYSGNDSGLALVWELP